MVPGNSRQPAITTLSTEGSNQNTSRALLNQFNQMLQTTEENDVNIRSDESVMMCKDVFWSPIGKPCEINNCGSPAYQNCN